MEHAWLCSAILRPLNIPARASIGSLEFWAQTESGEGVWVHLSTTGGRTTYRERGQLGSGFCDSAPSSRFSALSRPIIHEDWDAQNKGLWRERHSWGELYSSNSQGYDQAVEDLRTFSETGEAEIGNPPPPGCDSYKIDYSHVTINLLNMQDQRTLTVRFPMTTDSEFHQGTGDYGYWTNHPECILQTWIEEITNPPVIATEEWFNIQYNLRPLLDCIGNGDVNFDGEITAGDAQLAFLGGLQR